MEINKNLRKIIELVFMSALVSLIIFASNISLLILATAPVLLSIYLFKNGFAEFILLGITSLIFGLMYMSLSEACMLTLAIFLVCLILSLPIKYIRSDKLQILTSFVLISLVLIGFYTYGLMKEKVDFDSLARQVKLLVESSIDYKMDIEIYRASLSLYPAIFAFFSFIYTLLALKLIRNYASIKLDGFKDLTKVNEQRISYKDLLIIGLACVLAYGFSYLFKLNMTYASLNIIMIFLELLAFNGFSLYDYMIARSNIPLSRGFQWFFVIILIQFLLIFFVILGFIDIILDIRKKRSLNEK